MTCSSTRPDTALRPDYIIGFLGAGQLARMSAMAAFRLGVQAASYSGTPEGGQPLDLITSLSFPGTFEDLDRLIHFANQCDVVTLENEFLDGQILEEMQGASGTPLYPSPATFKLLESKYLEKETFKSAGLPVTPYRIVLSKSDLDAIPAEFGYPFILKSSKGGYDGYGNVSVSKPEDLGPAFQKLGGEDGRELIAEAYIPFHKELAVQVARNHTGMIVYPCCETIQFGHICKTVLAPAAVDPEISRNAQEIAMAAVESVDGTGLFAFEFFLTRDGRLLLNESAPRPHNSGHYTIEGCITSQFENHARAVMGLPLGSAHMVKPCAVMENLLGTRNRSCVVEGTEELWKVEDVYLHLYGKQNSRVGRKMGHITLLGDQLDRLQQTAKQLENRIEI